MPPAEAAQGKRKLPEPPEAMVTPDKKIHVPTGSTGSSARRILFNNKKHRELPDAAVLQGEDFEEVQSKNQLCPPVPSGACPMGEPAQMHCSGNLRAAAVGLFGNMPKAQQMGEYFQVAEQQVRQRFQERWGVDSHTGRPVESGRWQWSVSCILPGGNLQPLM
ncbi:g1121 [Coccomyxa elongata]